MHISGFYLDEFCFDYPIQHSFCMLNMLDDYHIFMDGGPFMLRLEFDCPDSKKRDYSPNVCFETLDN